MFQLVCLLLLGGYPGVPEPAPDYLGVPDQPVFRARSIDLEPEPPPAVKPFTPPTHIAPPPVKPAVAKPPAATKTAPVAPRVAAPQPGMHSHKCGSCGHVFWHFSGSHNCPKCGTGPWLRIHQGSSGSSRPSRGWFRSWR